MQTKLRQKSKKAKLNANGFIPSDHRAIKIMEDRARALAETTKINSTEEECFQYIACMLGDNALYGIPYFAIQEVISDVTVAKIPGSQNYIAGVINYRGMLIGIIDLQAFLFSTSTESKKGFEIIILFHQHMCVGILVDKIVGSYSYNAGSIQPPLINNTTNDISFFLGLHQKKITILNIENICKKLKMQNIPI